MKSVKLQKNHIVNAALLREYCEENSVVPEDENKFFIPYYYINGETTSDLVITIIWTTSNLMARISRRMLQDDATYKLNWYQYPLFVSGRSSPSGRYVLPHSYYSVNTIQYIWYSSYLTKQYSI